MLRAPHPLWVHVRLYLPTYLPRARYCCSWHSIEACTQGVYTTGKFAALAMRTQDTEAGEDCGLTFDHDTESEVEHYGRHNDFVLIRFLSSSQL